MWNSFKTELSQLLDLSKDALHIHIGIAIFLLAAVLLRKSLGSWVPWLVVLALQMVNEYLDAFHGLHGSWALFFDGGIKDIVNTMFWPTLIVLLSRHISHRAIKAEIV